MTMPSSSVPCQTTLLLANDQNDATLYDQKHAGSKSNLILITSNQSLINQTSKWTRKTFAFDVVKLEGNNAFSLLKSYVPLRDMSWRMLGLAFFILPPFSIPIGRGQVVGTDFDIWKILFPKLRLRPRLMFARNIDDMIQRVNL